VVAATGPSLTAETAELVRASGLPVVAVNDAWRRLPQAEVLYASDLRWWNYHKGCPGFRGERWSTHTPEHRRGGNDKSEIGPKYGLHLIDGRDGDGFSFRPDRLHHGGNSGFAAVNMAILLSSAMAPEPQPVEIVMVGFDMHRTNGRHFFGDHPTNLANTSSYLTFIRNFDRAARLLPKTVRIVNATPGSALRCFPIVKPGKVLHDRAAQSVAA
jgi:hypothetical protein